MTGWKEVLSREAERWLAGTDAKEKKKKIEKIRKCVSSICRTWDDLLDTDQEKVSTISTGNSVALLCSLKALPNIVLQVAQTSYRWGSRAVGECSCCLLMQLREQPAEETVRAWWGEGKSEVLHQQLRCFGMWCLLIWTLFFFPRLNLPFIFLWALMSSEMVIKCNHEEMPHSRESLLYCFCGYKVIKD